MDNDLPLVSIVTPSFNQDKFIEDAILSVKNQCYSNIEHIIVDGGSTDNTLDIIRKYEGKYNLRWISEPDQGQSDAINKGFRMAKGEIIGWINSDDAYFSRYTINKIVEFFKKYEHSAIVYGDIILIDSENMVIRICPILPAFKYSALKMRNILAQPSVFFRRCIIDEYHLNPLLYYGMDYDFWLRIGENNNFFYINDILSCFRLHDSSKTVAQYEELEGEFLDISRNYMKPLEKTTFSDKITHIKRRILPVLSLPRALQLYARQDFAFNMKLPTKRRIIINTILIPELYYRIKELTKHQ